MQAVANNPKFAKKVGVPTKVGKKFTKETKVKKKVKKYEDGGNVARSPLLDVENLRQLQARDAREKARMAREMGSPKTPGDLAKIQAKRDARGMLQQKAHEMRMRANLGSAIKGEEAKAAAQARGAIESMRPPTMGTAAAGMQRQQRPAGMKKGGAVKSKSKTNCRRGDGICKQGKTKGRMV